MPKALESPLSDRAPASATRADDPFASGPESALIEPHDRSIEEPVRSQALPGRMLDREADAELQCIVEAAASGTGFPMAAVSLGVLHSVVFRAHVGLPPELE